MVVSDEPTAAEFGVIDVRTGTGLGDTDPEMTKGRVPEDAPPEFWGLLTAICTVAAVARSAATSVVWRLADETKRVARFVPPHVISEPATKLLPCTVSVSPGLPAVAEEGLREEMDGAATGVELFTFPPEPHPTVDPARQRMASKEANQRAKLFIRYLWVKLSVFVSVYGV
jgi:hypothetical protein